MSMKFGVYIDVDEWRTTVCSMTRSNHPRSRSRALQSWKYGRFQKLSRPLFTMGAGNWPWILILGHTV